jgi:hypothetical protein
MIILTCISLLDLSLATADALDEYLEVLERKGFGKKTILTRMGVVFSMLKDHTKEKGNGPAESAVD